jgi:hypothetical protein
MRVVEDTATRSSGSLPPYAMPPSSYDLNASLIRPIACRRRQGSIERQPAHSADQPQQLGDAVAGFG